MIMDRWNFFYHSISEKITKDTFVISDTHFGHERMMVHSHARRELAGNNVDEVGTPGEGHAVVEEMMVKNWNSVVGKDDIVLHLGDFAFNEIHEWTRRLNGRKILIKGNHDTSEPTHYERNGWLLINNAMVCSEGFDYAVFFDRNSERIVGKDVLCSWCNKEHLVRPRAINCIVLPIDGVRVMISHVPAFHDPLAKDYGLYGSSSEFLRRLFDARSCELNVHGHIHEKDAFDRCCVNVSAEVVNFTPVRLGTLIEAGRRGVVS
jgi:calcineurin-like phosphoesterase family protein